MATKAKKRPTTKRARPASAPRRKVQETARGQARDVFRASIIAAAERVFARRGFVQSKVADIAREAGLAAGTLYNYFDSKEEIFQTLCAERGREAFAVTQAIFDGEHDPALRLARLVEWVFEHIEQNAATFSAYVQLGGTAEWQLRQLGGAEAVENYSRHLALFQRAIRDAQGDGHLRQDITAADLTSALTGAINGFIHAWALAGAKPPLKHRARQVLDLFHQGAAVR